MSIKRPLLTEFRSRFNYSDRAVNLPIFESLNCLLRRSSNDSVLSMRFIPLTEGADDDRLNFDAVNKLVNYRVDLFSVGGDSDSTTHL